MLKKHKLEKGYIFHSDRDIQYTSGVVMKLLKQYGLCQAFSARTYLNRNGSGFAEVVKTA